MTTGRFGSTPVPFTVRSVMLVGTLVGGSSVVSVSHVKSVLKVTPVEFGETFPIASV